MELYDSDKIDIESSDSDKDDTESSDSAEDDITFCKTVGNKIQKSLIYQIRNANLYKERHIEMNPAKICHTCSNTVYCIVMAEQYRDSKPTKDLIINNKLCKECLDKGYICHNSYKILDTPKEPTQGECTYNITKDTRRNQYWYKCKECFSGVKYKGCCVYCAYECQKLGHTLILYYSPMVCSKEKYIEKKEKK
jgi:hypothetical protein